MHTMYSCTMKQTPAAGRVYTTTAYFHGGNMVASLGKKMSAIWRKKSLLMKNSAPQFGGWKRVLKLNWLHILLNRSSGKFRYLPSVLRGRMDISHKGTRVLKNKTNQKTVLIPIPTRHTWHYAYAKWSFAQESCLQTCALEWADYLIFQVWKKLYFS